MNALRAAGAVAPTAREIETAYLRVAVFFRATLLAVDFVAVFAAVFVAAAGAGLGAPLPGAEDFFAVPFLPREAVAAVELSVTGAAGADGAGCAGAERGAAAGVETGES